MNVAIMRHISLIQINVSVVRRHQTSKMFRKSIRDCACNVLIGFIVALPVGAAAQELGPLTPDTPTRSAEIEVVCTGVSLDARENPAWTAYPLKVEVAGRGGQYLGDVHLMLSRQSKTLVALTCGGPWVLFRLPTGRYRVEALTEGRSVSSSAFVPATGQGRVILRFPELGGEASLPAAETNPVVQPAAP